MKILDFVRRTKLAFNPKLELKDDFDWRATDIGIGIENTAKLQLCNYFDVLLTQKIVIIIIEKNRSELFNQR
jgi:hypothetical protein